MALTCTNRVFYRPHIPAGDQSTGRAGSGNPLCEETGGALEDGCFDPATSEFAEEGDGFVEQFGQTARPSTGKPVLGRPERGNGGDGASSDGGTVDGTKDADVLGRAPAAAHFDA